VKVSDSNVKHLKFCDALGRLIQEIKGNDHGTWHTITAKPGETFIGFQEAHSSTYGLDAIGFIAMKQLP